MPQVLPVNTEHGPIRPLSGNPRQITDAALRRLAESIKRDPEFMRLRPIVIDEAGTVLGGNQRLRACAEVIGMTELPPGWVVRAEGLTAEQRKRFVLVDNVQDGEWDFAELAAGFGDIDLVAMGIDIPITFADIPTGNKSIDEDAMKDTRNECPKCGFKW